jgi:hypothetical protein
VLANPPIYAVRAGVGFRSTMDRAQTRRRRSSEDRPPAPPKGIKRKRAQARVLGFDRGRLYPLLPHGYALG